MEAHCSSHTHLDLRMTGAHRRDFTREIDFNKLARNKKIGRDHDPPRPRGDTTLERRFEGWLGVIQIANLDDRRVAARPHAFGKLAQRFAGSAQQASVTEQDDCITHTVNYTAETGHQPSEVREDFQTL